MFSKRTILQWITLTAERVADRATEYFLFKGIAAAVAFTLLVSVGEEAAGQSTGINQIYGVSASDSSSQVGLGPFWKNDPETLLQEKIGNTGFQMQSLAFDPLRNIFYANDGIEAFATDLWAVDRATGAPTRIGPINLNGGLTIQGLAYDYVRDIL